MVSNKTAALSIVIGLLVGLELNRLYVPENFESPMRFKAFATTFRFITMISKLGSTLGFGSEASILSSIVEKTSSFVSHTDDKVTMEDTIVSNIRVRIYKPKSIKKDDKLPIMVYYHGGGYAFGSLNTYDYYLFEFVKQLNMVIVSVDYRMAPENPYPIPTNDCFDVTKYVIEHPTEFNADVTKLVLAGDSAGGNAATVVSTRIAKENLRVKPKIQVLIYPWVQLFFTKLPSYIRYENSGFSGTKLTAYASWYLGIANITQDLMTIYQENEHLALLNSNEQNKIKNILDASKIPDKYKPDKAYYETQGKYQIPSKVPENSLLKRDPKVAELIRKLFDPKLSPLFATKEDLAILPKTYLLVLEWDSLKDEALLYAERLKEAGISTHVDFFENAFHGIAGLTHGSYGYQIARDMQDKLIKYLKENL